ncbi:MAG TPA: DUF1684 domain-containing protein [Bryobacteraceae bacterium]|nr:DUF1684 domain-containing protein [Bryobacteraceae bacterium]
MPRVAPLHLAILSLAALLVSAAVPARDFLKMENEWRAKRQNNLTKPDGWLAVAGLFWLHDGVMSIGSDPQSDVVLPAGAPRKLGTLRMQKGVVSLDALPGTGAMLNGKPLTRATLKPDTDDHPDTVQVGSLLLTVIKRMDRTGIRMRDPNAATRRNFTGCKWFPASEKWRIHAKWIPYPAPKNIRITNILGMTDEEPSPGYAEFTVDGKAVRLEPVADDDGSLSFMFKDATAGSSTYAQGRFLDTDKPKDGFVTLDFNQAYNPPCAFIAFATCPLPPRQNTLTVAIEAGEKKYANHPGTGGR